MSIYAIRSGDFVKIGYSADPWKRLSAIRNGNPHPCEMVGFLPGSKRQEKSLHVALAQWRHRGEWFRFEGEVAQFVAKLTPVSARYDRRCGPRAPEVIASVRAGLIAAYARRA